MNYKNYLRPGKGATDITPLLANSAAFQQLIIDLANLFSNNKIDLVACIEGRGFILGGAVAYHLNSGLIPLRYPNKLKNETFSQTFVDYSGNKKELQIHKDAIKSGQQVLIVDDWLETGETIKAAISLVEKCGGQVVGIGIFMDDSSKQTKKSLMKYNYKYLEMVGEKDAF
jgi:adenine phosphoribosyltransferase